MFVQNGERLPEASVAGADTTPHPHVVALRERVEALASHCADAEAEFDAAVAAGFPMHLLVLRDQEFVAATRAHRDAVRDLHQATHAPVRRPFPVTPRH